MNYSIYCGTLPVCGGGAEKKRWHLWNLTVLPEGLCCPAAAVVVAGRELGQGFAISAFGRMSRDSGHFMRTLWGGPS